MQSLQDSAKHKCPLCESSNITDTNLKKNGYDLIRCDNCHLHFVNPLPNVETLDNYYKDYLTKKGYKYLDKKFSSYKIKRIWQKRFNLLKRYVTDIKNRKFLEIGAGTGEWLKTLQINGVKDFVGIEPNKEEYNILKEDFRNNIINEDLEKFHRGNFDVICVWDVLEHFTDIKAVFRKLKNSLNKNGFLVFSTVNTNALSFQIKKDKWKYFFPPEHVLYFNKENVKYIGKRYNMDLVYFKTRLQLQNFFDKGSGELKKEGGISGYKLKLLLEDILNPFLVNNGDIITFILQKKD